jgi:hypothetical protein
MSIAPYGTPCANPSHQPTNLPLDVSDLTLRFNDGTRIRENKIPLSNENPILFTVKFRNKPRGVEKMVMNVIISDLGKVDHTKGRSGKFSKNITSTTYQETVPIVTDARGHSMTIQIEHASAPSGGFHDGGGPYDVYMSFSPANTGTQDAGDGRESTAGTGSQSDETLRYTLTGVED